MELVARDRRIVELAIVADLTDQRAHFVLLAHRLHDRLARDVDPETLVQRLKHVGFELVAVVLVGNLVVLEGDVGEGAEKVVVVDDAHVLHRVEMLLLQMLLETAGRRARLRRHLGVEEVEAAFQRALHQTARIVAHAR